LTKNYQVTAVVGGLSVWKLSCTIWSCCFYTVSKSKVKSVKYTLPYIYLYLSLLGVMPDPPPNNSYPALFPFEMRATRNQTSKPHFELYSPTCKMRREMSEMSESVFQV